MFSDRWFGFVFQGEKIVQMKMKLQFYIFAIINVKLFFVHKVSISKLLLSWYRHHLPMKVMNCHPLISDHILMKEKKPNPKFCCARHYFGYGVKIMNFSLCIRNMIKHV